VSDVGESPLRRQGGSIVASQISSSGVIRQLSRLSKKRERGLRELIHIVEKNRTVASIGYASLRSGNPEVYVRPYAIPGSGKAPAGPVIQISRDGGVYPVWSADGKELFFASLNPVWAMSAKIDQSSGAFRPEAPVRLGFQLDFSSHGPGWALSKNNQRFLVVAPLDRGAQTPITVVTNWEAALKRN
jgi:hypothetical protein